MGVESSACPSRSLSPPVVTVAPTVGSCQIPHWCTKPWTPGGGSWGGSLSPSRRGARSTLSQSAAFLSLFQAEMTFPHS